MNQERLIGLQVARGADSKSMQEATQSMTMEAYTTRCREFIKNSSNDYRYLEVEAKKDAIKKLITDYVNQNQSVSIENYTSGNRMEVGKVIDKLVEDITDYGILSKAMENPDVYEIRANGKEIKVEIKGRVKDLTDTEGNIVSFDSPEQQEIIMRKLLGDVKLTPKDALVNARTVEGYRIAAVHFTAMSPDPQEPNAPRYNSFVLRKFKKDKMGLGDIVKFGTLSDNMARLLALCPRGGLTWMTVGPTSSGKTTMNNAILQEMPADTRTVLAQNPSEIDLRFKTATGRVYNDVLHLEAKEVENPTPKDPTMQNIMTHILRLSPTFVCFGELRTNMEFKLGMQIMQAGHPINCTFHAGSSEGAIKRFLTAYLAESGNEPSDLALYNITSLCNLVIVQKILRDGTRKIIQISEVVGVKDDNPNAANINDLYKFIVTGTEYDDNGFVKDIKGYHKRVGCLTQELQERMALEGVTKSQFDFIAEPPTKDEPPETYTGENIRGYGINYGK